MQYAWLEDYCLQKKGAVREWKEEWQAYRYMVGGKMFVMEGGDKEEKAIITLKLDPLHGDAARREYDCVAPGYYMNKDHWNSVYRDGNVPDEALKDMLDESYRLVLGTLSQKKQKEILGD